MTRATAAVERIGVVGASAAGVSAAFELRRLGFEGAITVFDADRRLPYERPPLSKVLGRTEADLLVPIVPAHVYAEHAIELRLGATVTSLDRSGPGVVVAGTRHRFDRLLLSPGARPAVPSRLRAQAGNVFTLRSGDDALAISARLVPGLRLVVVGGGFIGLEVAAAAASLGVGVVVVEAAARPCLGSVGPVVGAHLAALHRDRGVELRLSERVAGLVGDTIVDEVVLASGERIAADLVVMGLGAVPNVELAAAAGLSVDGGIVVDETAATDVPGIFAAGDAAALRTRHQPRPRRVEHWDHARNQGAVAARSMLGIGARHTAVPYFWSEQYGFTLQMFGHPDPQDELVMTRTGRSGPFRAFWLRGGRMVAAAALSERPALAGARSLIELGLPVQAAELGREDTDLRELARRARRAAHLATPRYDLSATLPGSR